MSVIFADEIGHDARQTFNAELDFDVVVENIDALDKQLQNPRLLGGKPFVPQWFEGAERFPNFGFGKPSAWSCEQPSRSARSAPAWR